MSFRRYIDLIVPEVVKSLPESEQQAAWPGWPARLQAWQRALTQDPHVVEMMRRLRPAAQAWMEGKLGVQRRG
jgi:deoxyribodipyrimidine photolyase